MTAGELQPGECFLWWGGEFRVTGEVREADSEYFGWTEAECMAEPRYSEATAEHDLCVFPPEELVQLVEVPR